jgi:hypothetical protein
MVDTREEGQRFVYGWADVDQVDAANLVVGGQVGRVVPVPTQMTRLWLASSESNTGRCPRSPM